MMMPRIPRDTRLIEFASGWSMLLTALLMPIEVLAEDLMQISPAQGWSVFLMVAGALHLVAVYMDNRVEVLRAALSFVSGVFWVWVALLSLYEPHISAFAAFSLGVGNLTAFLVNALAVRWTWSH